MTIATAWVPRPARKLVTYLGRHGLRTTGSRVARESYELAREVIRRQVSSPVEPEVRAGDVEGRLERPPLGAVGSGTAMVVSGWAHSRSGIDMAEVFLDRTSVAVAALERARPDTALTESHVGDVSSSGFSAVVPLPDGLAPGRHALDVVVRDRAGAVRVLRRTFKRTDPRQEYERWYRRASGHDLRTVRAASPGEDGGASPIDLLVLVDGAGDLAATTRSIAAQAGGSWRATLVVGDEDAQQAAAAIPDGANGRGAPHARWSTAAGVDVALERIGDSGGLVGFLRAGETLAPAAIGLLARAASDSGVELLYSDHDQVDVDGSHVSPVFAPDWSPGRLLCQDYVGGVFFGRAGARL